jgi:hypothetical protein
VTHEVSRLPPRGKLEGQAVNLDVLESSKSKTRPEAGGIILGMSLAEAAPLLGVSTLAISKILHRIEQETS